MRRRVWHRYDLPRRAYDRHRSALYYQLQMCGRIALVFFGSCAIACLVGGAILLAKFFTTALVVVQP